MSRKPSVVLYGALIFAWATTLTETWAAIDAPLRRALAPSPLVGLASLMVGLALCSSSWPFAHVALWIARHLPPTFRLAFRRVRWIFRRGPRRLQAARARRSLKTGGDPFLAFLAVVGEHEAAKAAVSMMITVHDPARRAAIYRDTVLRAVAPGGRAPKAEAPR